MLLKYLNFKTSSVLPEYHFSYLDYIVYTLLLLVPLLLVIALFTLAERKVMAGIQRRKGPEVVGLFGFLQPFADGLKLVVKEIVIPYKASKVVFILGPALTLFLGFIGWVAIPLDSYTIVLNLNYSVLYVLVVSSLGVYGIFLAGWASNSKYALMGSLRSIAQMISYEVSISLIVIPIILLAGSLNFNKIIYMQQKTVWFIFPLFPLAIIFFISILAETNRAPFDLPEAEAELVAGYNVEYSAMTFAAFFLGEYGNILLMSSLFVIFFLGGDGYFWSSNLYIYSSATLFKLIHQIMFSLKVVFLAFLFIFIRANLPRFRFDQLMFIGWKIFLPITLGFVFFYSSFLFSSSSLEIMQIPGVTSVQNFIESFSIKF